MIDHQVHRKLAGNSALTGEASAAHVHNHHVGGVHSPLADAGGGDKQAVLVETNGKVAVSGGDKAILMQHASELHNLEAIFAVAGHLNLAAMVQHASEPLQELAR